MSPECLCGEHVSKGWQRVFAVDGQVRACPECAPKTIPDVTEPEGGEYSAATRATQSQRAGGGR